MVWLAERKVFGGGSFSDSSTDLLQVVDLRMPPAALSKHRPAGRLL